MKKNKTIETTDSVYTFLNTFVNNEKMCMDSAALIEHFSKWSGLAPKMWGTSIIGFGKYHYKYPSGHEGDAPILGFSPRKNAISLYIYSDTEKSKKLLENLGKFTMGKSCIYIKKLSDIDVNALRELCLETIAFITSKYTIIND